MAELFKLLIFSYKILKVSYLFEIFRCVSIGGFSLGKLGCFHVRGGEEEGFDGVVAQHLLPAGGHQVLLRVGQGARQGLITLRQRRPL